MVHNRKIGRIGLLFVMGVLLCAPVLHAAAPESKRLERAKDLIADEQWIRAVDELKLAVRDPKETNKDEALFWLAHSFNQARDKAAAVETIQRLEREFPKSPWLKPAQSLRVEIAGRLRQNDVLWWTAVAPPPPPPAVSPTLPVPPGGASPVAAPVPPAPPVARSGRRVRPSVPQAAAPAPPVPPRPPVPPSPASAVPPFPNWPAQPMPPPPPAMWMPEHFQPDTDLRIQALGTLIRTDALKVIPMLKAIALESDNAAEAGRALFYLAQSDRPEARLTVVEVARSGSEPVRLAAVRELGRVGGPTVSNELLEVYSTANPRVKYEVVTSLGLRDSVAALMRIAQTESNRELRNNAIVTLGEAGGVDQLRMLFTRAAADSKRPIIIGLFNAHAVDDLIRIADHEQDPVIRQEVLTRLRLLGTPKAKEYLERATKK